jgi:hypothetical protein
MARYGVNRTSVQFSSVQMGVGKGGGREKALPCELLRHGPILRFVWGNGTGEMSGMKSPCLLKRF